MVRITNLQINYTSIKLKNIIIIIKKKHAEQEDSEETLEKISLFLVKRN